MMTENTETIEYSLDPKSVFKDYVKKCFEFQEWVQEEFNIDLFQSAIIASFAIQHYSVLIKENSGLRNGIAENVEYLRTEIEKRSI